MPITCIRRVWLKTINFGSPPPRPLYLNANRPVHARELRNIIGILSLWIFGNFAVVGTLVELT
jgi:hypothetical protein